MKKLTALILSVIFIFCLNGCAKTNTQSNTVTDLKLYFPELKNHQGYALDGILYTVQTNSDASKIIKCIDYENKVIYPLCSNIQCTHNNETCPAWFEYFGSEMACVPYNDSLFIFQSLAPERYVEKYNDKSISKIFVSNLDGSNRKILAEFAPNQTTFGQFAFDENNIYSLMRETVEESDNQIITTTYIISVNMTSGEVNKLYSFQGYSPQILGVKESSLILIYDSGSNGELSRKLLEFNIAEKTSQYIIDIKSSENVYIASDKIYIDQIVSDKMSVLDINTYQKTDEYIYGDENENTYSDIVEMFDNYFIYYVLNDKNEIQYYIYDTENKQTELYGAVMEIENLLEGKQLYHVSIVDSFKEYYIVNNSGKFEDVLYPEPNGDTLKFSQMNYDYAMIKKDDLINGNYNYIPFNIL